MAATIDFVPEAPAPAPKTIDFQPEAVVMPRSVVSQPSAAPAVIDFHPEPQPVPIPHAVIPPEDRTSSDNGGFGATGNAWEMRDLAKYTKPADSTLNRLAPLVTSPQQAAQLSKVVTDLNAPKLPTPGAAGQAWDAAWSAPKPFKDIVEIGRGIQQNKQDTTQAMRAMAIKHGLDPDKVAPLPSLIEQFLRGAGNSIVDTAGTLMSPGGVATLGFGALPVQAQKAASLGFSAQMLSQFPDQAQALLDEEAKPAGERDGAKISQLYLNMLTGTGMGLAAGAHGTSKAGPVMDNLGLNESPKVAVNDPIPAKVSQGGIDFIPEQAPPLTESVKTQADNIGTRLAAANPDAVARTADGAVDTVQTALNAMKQAQAPSGAATGGAEPTIADRAAAEPDRPVTMADLSALVNEIKTKDRFGPGGVATGEHVSENDLKAPENSGRAPAPSEPVKTLPELEPSPRGAETAPPAPAASLTEVNRETPPPETAPNRIQSESDQTPSPEPKPRDASALFDTLVKDFGPLNGWSTGDEAVYDPTLKSANNAGSSVTARVKASADMQAMRRKAASDFVPDRNERAKVETPEGRAALLPRLVQHLQQVHPGDEGLAKTLKIAEFNARDTESTTAERSQRAEQDAGIVRDVIARKQAEPEYAGLEAVAGTGSRRAGATVQGDAGRPGGGGGSRQTLPPRLQAKLERAFGVRIVEVRKPGGTVPFNGAKPFPNRNLILLAQDAHHPLLAVAGHEIAHHIEQTHPGLYSDMVDRLMPLMQRVPEYQERLQVRGEKSDELTTTRELVGDFIGDNLNRPEFWDQLAQRDPGLFKRLAARVVSYLDKVMAKLTGAGVTDYDTGKFFKDLKAARDIVAESLARFAKEQVTGIREPGDYAPAENSQFSRKEQRSGDLFGAPESVSDQKARMADEKRSADEAKAKADMLDGAQARLTGKDIDTTPSMFGAELKVDKAGQGSLFSRKQPDAVLNEPAKPERERSAEQVRAELADAEAALKRATVRDTAKQSQSDYKQAAALAGARYRTLRDELLNHPEHVGDTLLKQQAAVTEANELLKPLGQAIHPEEVPDLGAAREKLTPEQFKRLQQLQEQIQDTHAEIQRMPKKLVARVFNELQDAGKLPEAAKPDPNVGRSLDQVTDWLRSHGVDSPKKSLLERFNLAARMRNMVAGARTSIQKALLTSRAVTRAAVESYKSPPKDDDFRTVIKSWLFADQRTGLATHQFVKELVAKVPNAARRRAMAIWLDADGDKSLLEFQAQSVPDNYVNDWKLALKLTPDEQALARQISADFDKKLEDGQAVGLIDRGREQYGVPQRWKLKPDVEADYSGGGKKGSPGRINAKLDPRNPFFSFQREVPTYFEGIMAKGVPENLDIAHLVATYDQAFHKSLSSRGMIAALQEARAKDGLPVTKISGSANIASSADGKAYFVDSKAWNKSDVSSDGRPYRSLDHSALKGWKIALKDEKGNPIIVKGDMLIHPDHYDYLKNELGQSALREIPLVKGVLASQAFLKASKLSGSAFHLMTIGEHMASHLVNPFLNGFKIDLRQPDQALLVRNGLELGMGSPQMGYEEGLASAHSGLFNKIPGLGDASAKLTDWMFKDYIPSIMMKVGLHALESNRKRYGDKLTPDQVAELTAQQMNAAGGLMNYRLRGADGNMWGKLGANKTVMDLQRMALMAPQFLEARLRVVGQALKPYGHEQRKMLITQAAVLYIGARVLNQLLDGDPHWTDNPFSVVHKGRAYSIRTIVGDFWHLLNDPASFAAGRLSPLLKIGVEDVAGGGRDMRTGARKETPIETQNPVGRMAQNIVMDLANWLTPIPVEGLLPGASGKDQTAAGMLLSSVGVGSRKFTAVNQVRDLAADFNRNNPDPNAQRMQAGKDAGSFGHSAYAKLDSLLDAGDTNGARRELEALQKDGIPLARITSRYEREAPFTGSAEREQDFVAQLTPKQQELYQKARQEQKARARAFAELQP